MPSGLDIGSTSVKLVTADGERRERAHGPDLDEIVAAALELVPDGPFGISSAMHSLVGLDARDRPVTPLHTWLDISAVEQAERLRREHPDLHARTGTPLHPMSPLTKLVWFREQGVTARRWVGFKELVVHRLTGEWVVDHSVASGTGLLALATLDWDDEALGLAGVERDQLPRLVPATERFGDLVIGAGDGPCANLGLGATEPGIAACSIGTSAALRVTVADPGVTDATFCYALTPGRWVVGGALNNAGSVLDWLAELFGAGHEELLAEAAEVETDGLVMHPYLYAERAPHWDARVRASIEGLTHAHTRGHLVRAALEGVCHQLRLVLDSLIDAGYRVDQVRATGGFMRSELWKQLLADALAVPVDFTGARDASAYGAALIAREALA
jgi:gluconokinase